MRHSLRWHICLTILPLVLILIVLGGAGVWLLHHLGNSVNMAIREDFDSVIYMEKMRTALERIDTSYKFALAGQEEQAHALFESAWKKFDKNLDLEKHNTTVPGEAELVEELDKLAENYRRHSHAFFRDPPGSPERFVAYGTDQQPGVLRELDVKVKAAARAVQQLNQDHLEQASRGARATADSSLAWFGIILAVALLAAGWFAWRTMETILEPIRAVIASAREISAGNLDQIVPVASEDELGQLAQSFNLMARHLRDYRQSQLSQLLRAQRTSQATIDSFPDPVLVIDSEGYVEMANPAARTLLGVTPRLKNRPETGIWEPPAPLSQPLAEAMQGQCDYLPEGFDKVLLLGPEGRERAVLPHILTIRDPYGNTLGAAVLLQDVTRMRLLDEMKSNLVATASHELKTPLTSIRLAVHLLFEEAAGPLTVKQTELLQDARDNTERLLSMVNNLLDIARFEQGSRQLDIHPQSPEFLLRTAAEAIRPQAEEKGVAVILDLPAGLILPMVDADATRIGTALRNLLENALTYTESASTGFEGNVWGSSPAPGGRITLSAEVNLDRLVLRVADTGCGIPAEHLPHIFKKFYRVPGQSRGSGTGLGLAIVSEIVTAHGGSISCSSQPGEGTSFDLALPIHAELGEDTSLGFDRREEVREIGGARHGRR